MRTCDCVDCRAVQASRLEDELNRVLDNLGGVLKRWESPQRASNYRPNIFDNLG